MPAEEPRGGLSAERRRHVRNNVIAASLVVLLACAATLLVVLLAVAGRGPNVPDVRGLAYEQARKKVESAGFSIEIDPTQDSSGDCDSLEVLSQDPKPGSRAEADEVVTVRLRGLHESPELLKDLSGGKNLDRSSAPGAAGRSGEQPRQEAAGQPRPAGRVVCIDPGHSGRNGGEIDPATGLNVGDNTGAAGEVQAMWELAHKAKARLEGAGYVVRLTKQSADSYASLRERADIGNACEIVIRLHYDPSGFTGVMRPPAGGARCPLSDPARITSVSPEVAAGSHRLATCLASTLGLAVRDDTGGTSRGNGTPAGHRTALVGSVLSRVPVVCVENRMGLVRGNPGGQDEVARGILSGVDAYFGR